MAAEWTKAEEVQWDLMLQVLDEARAAHSVLSNGPLRDRLKRAIDRIDDAFDQEEEINMGLMEMKVWR